MSMEISVYKDILSRFKIAKKILKDLKKQGHISDYLMIETRWGFKIYISSSTVRQSKKILSLFKALYKERVKNLP